jgi:hypothetical protein
MDRSRWGAPVVPSLHEFAIVRTREKRPAQAAAMAGQRVAAGAQRPRRPKMRREARVDRRSGFRPPEIWPPPKQLQDSLPGDVDQELVEGSMPTRVVVPSRGTEQPAFVQPDQGADRYVLGPLVTRPGTLDIAGGDAVLGEHGLTRRAVESVHAAEPSESLMIRCSHSSRRSGRCARRRHASPRSRSAQVSS